VTGLPDSDGEPSTPELPAGVRIVRPERVPVRTVWPSESANFTPWLGANLGFLDELGLGQLTLIHTEAQLPGIWRSLDVLAETADGRRVAIENQYSTVDHDHLTRGLAYAVGHEARALIVIAEEHRPEFVAVADYLNRCQEALGDAHGIAIFLVALSVERIDNAYVPRFTVLSRPNAWRAAVAASESRPFAGTEEFLHACEEPIRKPVQQIVQAWREHPGYSIRFSKTGVSLDVRNPFKTSGAVTSVFVLYTNGQLTLNRGYLVEGKMAPDETVGRLDERVRQLFPAGRWGKGSYYVTIPPPLDPDAVQTFRQWLDDHLVGLGSPSDDQAPSPGT
jgi:hypothetical protein